MLSNIWELGAKRHYDIRSYLATSFSNQRRNLGKGQVYKWTTMKCKHGDGANANRQSVGTGAFHLERKEFMPYPVSILHAV